MLKSNITMAHGTEMVTAIVSKVSNKLTNKIGFTQSLLNQISEVLRN